MFHNLFFLTLPPLLHKELLDDVGMGGERKAEDWLSSPSRGTSKPQALTVSIPQSDGETRFDVQRGRERRAKPEQKATGEENEE